LLSDETDVGVWHLIFLQSLEFGAWSLHLWLELRAGSRILGAKIFDARNNSIRLRD
jgi:hypothetical protein